MHLVPGSRGSADSMAAPIDRTVDVELGVLSTLVRAENFCPRRGGGYGTPGAAFLTNLGIKINLKLGGVHSTWKPPPYLKRRMCSTVVMGGDSTRSPGRSAIAAVRRMRGVPGGRTRLANRRGNSTHLLGASGIAAVEAASVVSRDRQIYYCVSSLV